MSAQGGASRISKWSSPSGASRAGTFRPRSSPGAPATPRCSSLVAGPLIATSPGARRSPIWTRWSRASGAGAPVRAIAAEADIRPRASVTTHDAIVVGGGFYGTRLALALGARGRSVLLLEREPQLLGRA